ncbi:MAG: hypothetical protein ACFFA6_07440 [Promethearchaeota archaeon]
MRYIFKILAFSGNSELSNLYISEAFDEIGEEKESYNEWYKEIKVLEDICDLEVDVITNIAADFDELLPTADGIIYFLNPLEIGEFELFKMILPDIYSVKRDIPTVIIFYDQSGILPMSVNELLETIWVNYLSLEAFVNLKPRNFHQALQSLCLAMINGDTPLNIENAWMRFPIFIQMANIYYENKNYYYAAQAVKKAALIADIYNKEEFFILSEQAAFLFSKLNLYLEASKILERVDRKKSINYKKLYAEAMITDANRLFNKAKYEKAARIYEKAAQWSSIELGDDIIIKESFRLAINSWISACSIENAFRILESLRHEELLIILKEISEKIRAEGDYLVSINNFEAAREQLYRAIYKYQREGLYDELGKLTTKMTEILIINLNQQIDQNKIYAAKETYDEIENMWESYNVKKKDLDSTLERLINLFLKEYNFGTSTILINKLSSLKIKKKLTKLSSIAEDEYKVSKKRELEQNVKRGVDILKEFVETEINMIVDMNYLKIEESKKLVKLNEHLKAAKILKNQADYLKTIGKEDIADQILTKSLDILLDAKNFEDFFVIYKDLTEDMKKKYLKRVYPLYLLKLNEIKDDIKKEASYEENEYIFEKTNRIFRNQMLYDESKEISLLYIKVIKKQTSRIVESEENLTGVNQAIELIKKISTIASAYLEKEEQLKINLDEVYKKITEIYIDLDDLHNAHIYNDRIENKGYKAELHKKIANLEAAKSEKKSKEVVESIEAEMLKERLSIVKNKGREALLDRENELKKRTGLKRVYFLDALNFLKEQELDKALEIYRNSIIEFNRKQNYNLAGVSLVLASLILLKQGKTEEIAKLLNEIKKELFSLDRLISESFPVKLIEYIIELEKLGEEPKLKEAISYIENLPLFEEELEFLYSYQGKDYQKEVKREKTIVQVVKMEKMEKKIENLANLIIKEKQDIAKRKLMKNQYWTLCLENLSNNKLFDASISYLDTVSKLIEKKFFKQAAIGLILSSIILINERNLQIAKETFEKYLVPNMKTLPEIEMITYLFSAIENKENKVVQLIINFLIEKLILFDPEIILLKSLLGEEDYEEQVKEVLSREEYGELSKLRIELDQRYAKIKSKLIDIQSEKIEFYNKRKAMRKRYYFNILNLLEIQEFKKAAEEYFDLAITIYKRKDLNTSSLLVLLHGLSLLKAGETHHLIKNNVYNFLDNLGVNKKLVEDNFYIRLILFIIDVKLYKRDKFLPKINDKLLILPLFEEEKVLLPVE